MSSTYVTKLNYLEETKELIKQAIIDKGVDVSDTDTFRVYADKIGEISGGGTPEIPRGTQLTLDDFPLCKALKEERYSQPFTFYDFDGTVLGTYTREQIQAMTSEEEFPAPIGNTEYPIHFDRWNWTLEELKEQPYGVDIGALYDHDTVDFAIYIKPEEEVSFKFGMSGNLTTCKFFIQNVDTEEYLYQDLYISPVQSFTVPAGHYLIGIVSYSNGEFNGLFTSNFSKDILNKLNIQMVCMNKSMSQHIIYEPLFSRNVSYAKDVRVKQYVCNLEVPTGGGVIDLVGYTDFIAEPRRLTRWSCSTKSAINPIKATVSNNGAIYYYNAKEAVIPSEKYKSNTVFFDTYQGKTFFTEDNRASFPEGQYLEAVYFETLGTSLVISSTNASTPNLKEFYVQGATLQELLVPQLKDCKEIKKFIVPDGVRKLNGVPQNVEAIYLPDTLRTIESDTFKNCKRLKTLYIPDSVQTIGEAAFAGTLLDETTLRLPEGVNISPKGTFSFTPIKKPFPNLNLSGTADYGLYGGCVFLKGEITVPDGFTSISNGANIINGGNEGISGGLSNCINITKVNLPETLTSLGTYGFANCVCLEEINLPSGITQLPSDVFTYCTSLKKITLPEGLTSIKGKALSNCKSLQSIELPDGITSLGSGYTDSSIFDGCSGLKSITLSNNLKSIGASTFNSCSSLTSITIPASVSDMNGSSIFNGCYSLIELHMKPTTPPTLNSSAFGYGSTLPGGEDTRIYVPYSEDHSVLAAYQSATNWSKWANYMVEEEV